MDAAPGAVEGGRMMRWTTPGEAHAYEVGYVEGMADARQWIPVKTRPMTEEEREYWSEYYGYDVEYEDANMFDCQMPEDGQEVWVCFKSGYVAEDVCDNDDGMIGLEGNGDWDDVVAWMPRIRPEPWKGEE